jgi:ureidoacrylate peracid hydrolase
MNRKVDLSVIHEHYISAESLDTKTSSYLDQLAPYNQRKPEFRLDEAALVLVDFQRCFLDPDHQLYSVNTQAVLARAVELTNFFRAGKRPVLYTLQKNKGLEIDRGPVLRNWWPAVPLEDSPETDSVDELKPLPGEKVIPKRRYSGFYSTDLELSLRTMGVSQVVVAGVFTNVCVEATVRDAFMRDYLVFLPADTTAAHNEQLHLGSLRTMAMWFASVCRVSDLTSS